MDHTPYAILSLRYEEDGIKVTQRENGIVQIDVSGSTLPIGFNHKHDIEAALYSFDILPMYDVKGDGNIFLVVPKPKMKATASDRR